MKNMNLNEEIQKIIFLSKYNTKNTLVENKILLEQVLTTVAKDVKLAGSTLAKAEAEAIMGRIAKNPNKYPGLTKIDDVVNGVKAGNPVAIQAVFKGTTNPQILNTLATKLINTPAVMNKLVTNAKNQKKSVDAYLRQLGYSDDSINALKNADKNATYFKPTGGVPGKPTPGKPSGGTKPTGKPKTKNTSKPSAKNTTKGQNFAKSKRGQKIKELGTWEKVKAHWSKYWMAYIGLGALAAAFWYFFPDGEIDDAEVNVEVDDTPVTGGGSGSGSGGGSSRWRDCSDFPYTQGCRSEVVREIQSCLKTDANGNPLRADGYFGPKTEGALTKKGYSTEVTKEVYDKIKSACGTTTGGGGEEEKDDVNPYDQAPSAEEEGL
jgi:hypothetical protein